MILTIDIGNTNVLTGVYDGEKLVRHWRIDSRVQRTSDEWGMLILTHLERRGGNARDVEGIIISSVVPELDFPFSRMAEEYFKKKAVFVHSGLNLGLRIKYTIPEQVGADRLCNAVAALKHYQSPIIIIDFGTATTYDVIAGENEYIGGVIAPGVETAAAVLHRQTARLPLVGMSFPEKIIGRTTETSIRSGILYGALVEMEGLVGKIKEEVGGSAVVIATGGYAGLFKEKTDIIQHVEPFLTLDGLCAIYSKLEVSR